MVGEEAVDAESEEAPDLGAQIAVLLRIGSAPELGRKEGILGAERPHVDEEPAAFASRTRSGEARALATPIARAYVAISARSGLPESPSSWTSGTSVMLRSCFRLAGSNDWRKTRASAGSIRSPSAPLRAAPRATARSHRSSSGASSRDRGRSGADADQVEDLLERRDRELAVEARAAQLRHALSRAQRLELREREVLGEPAGHAHAIDLLRRAPRRELGMTRHVGGGGDLVLVARDQHSVLRRDEVGLDEVGALLDRGS